MSKQMIYKILNHNQLYPCDIRNQNKARCTLLMFLNNFYKLKHQIVDVCFRFVILPLFNRYSFIYGQYVPGKEICQAERNWSILLIFTLSETFIVHIDGVSSTYCQVCLLCHHMKRRDLFGGMEFLMFSFFIM